MDSVEIVRLILTFIGSSAFSTLVIFFINRHDKKKGVYNDIKTGIDNLQNSAKEQKTHGLQTKLLVLMASYSDRYAEIFKVAEDYFVKCGGNDFVTPIFKDWLKKNNLKAPSWFNK